MKRLLRWILAALLLAAVAFGLRLAWSEWRDRRDAAERAASPQGRLPEGVRPQHYTLDLRIDPRKERFSGRARIAVVLDAPTSVVWLHGRDLEVSSAVLETADGRRLPLGVHEMGGSGVLRARLGETVEAQTATLDFDYTASLEEDLVGAYRVLDGDDAYVFTQFEAIDARRAFPGFDEPAFKTPFDLALSVPAGDVAVANTPAVEEVASADGWTRVRFATTPPLPTYLVAFAAGPFDVVDAAPVPANEVRPEPLPLRGIAVAGQGGKMAWALAQTGPIVELLERYFGTPYPFAKLDLVAVPDFAAGAMENPGLVTYKDQVLLLGDEPSVEDQRQVGLYHAHEFAHMWHGDLVTMPWWDDLWLNEAFASWMEVRTAELWRPDLELGRDGVRAAHRVMTQDALVTARRLRQPIASNHDIENAFDDISYDKGGAVLRMFESYLGEERFRAGVRRHLERFAFADATSDDFVESLAEGSGERTAAEALRTFLDQSGVPLVELDWSCGADGVELRLRQSRYLPVGSRGTAADRLWQVPVCWRRLGADGGGNDAGGGERECTLLGERQASVRLPGACPAAVMPNAGGLGYYRWSLGDEGLAALLGALDALTPEEVYSVIDDLAAELHAGRLDVDGYLAAVRRIGERPEWDLALAPRDELIFIADHLVSTDRRPEILAFIHELYVPRFEELGLEASTDLDRDDPASTALLRHSLVSTLALDAPWPPLREVLHEAGRRYLGFGGDGAVHPDAIASDLVSTALAVTVEEEGEPFFRALVDAVEASDDPGFRQRALWALGRVTEPDLAAEARGLVLSFSLQLDEKVTILLGQLQSPRNHDALYAWAKRYYPVMALFMPDVYLGQSPRIASGFCDREHLDDVRAFFEPRLDDVTGGPPVLANVLEEIELCTALAEKVSGRVP